MHLRFLLGGVLLFTTAVGAGASDHRGRERVYRVTVTNLTKGQVFSPPVLATHRSGVGFFELGQPATDELAEMAENGDGAPLAALLNGLPRVFEALASSTPILPGGTEVFEIRSRSFFDRISVAGMLVNTNDAFFAIDGERLPRGRGHRRTWTAVGYDAGSEFNGEDCGFIPGPACAPGSMDRDPGDPEGYVYVSNGVHGIADLASDAYDWHNPVARVTVERIR